MAPSAFVPNIVDGTENFKSKHVLPTAESPNSISFKSAGAIALAILSFADSYGFCSIFYYLSGLLKSLIENINNFAFNLFFKQTI